MQYVSKNSKEAAALPAITVDYAPGQSNVMLKFFEKVTNSEWPKVHFYIRPKPKAEYLKIFGLWPNTETEHWNFWENHVKNPNGQHNYFF